MDRRKKKTQASIMAAFETALAKKNFEQITVSQLCTLADINRGTFYLNYLDKYDLLEQVIKQQLNDLMIYCEENHQRVDNLTATFEYLLSQKASFIRLMNADNQGVFANHLINLLREKEPGIAEVKAIFIANGLVGVIQHLLIMENSVADTVTQFSQFLKQQQNFSV